jgi:3-hydroxyisobutyrate dehydrogenase-like beta-hydroxyacid dehydrogenase
VGAVTTGAEFAAATAKIAKQADATLLTLLDPPAATAVATSAAATTSTAKANAKAKKNKGKGAGAKKGN